MARGGLASELGRHRRPRGPLEVKGRPSVGCAVTSRLSAPSWPTRGSGWWQGLLWGVLGQRVPRFPEPAGQKIPHTTRQVWGVLWCSPPTRSTGRGGGHCGRERLLLTEAHSAGRRREAQPWARPGQGSWWHPRPHKPRGVRGAPRASRPWRRWDRRVSFHHALLGPPSDILPRGHCRPPPPKVE